MTRLEYVEIRDEKLEIVGIIDTAISVIWHRVFFGVGDFEIYVQDTPEHFAMLKRGRYVNSPDDEEIGIIEKVNPHASRTDGNVILASGRFAKSILDRRVIYRVANYRNAPTILQGNVETAVRKVISENAISSTVAARNIPLLALGAKKGFTPVIVDETGAEAQKQAAGEVLLDFTDNLLAEYKMAARLILAEDSRKLVYDVVAGSDRSMENTEGNEPVIFSPDFDNLSESTYSEDDTEYRNAALIGGAGQDVDRFFSVVADGEKTGLQRREMFVDASSVNQKYNTDDGTEQTYSDGDYAKMISTVAKQELSTHKVMETFSGEINTTFGQYVLNEDYFLGDLVTLQDNRIGKYATVRIIETTEVRDENGYSITAEYNQI